MPRPICCSICRAEIIEMLVDVGSTDTVCLECSGATLDDLVEEGDEYERVDVMRTFHGKSQYD